MKRWREKERKGEREKVKIGMSHKSVNIHIRDGEYIDLLP